MPRWFAAAFLSSLLAGGALAEEPTGSDPVPVWTAAEIDVLDPATPAIYVHCRTGRRLVERLAARCPDLTVLQMGSWTSFNDQDLAALSALPAVTSIRLHHVGYQEPGADGELLYVRDSDRVARRLVALIEARRGGNALPERWLADAPDVVEAARTRKRERIRRELREIRAEIRRLFARAAELTEEARRIGPRGG